jgi:hypothetical protein
LVHRIDHGFCSQGLAGKYPRESRPNSINTPHMKKAHGVLSALGLGGSGFSVRDENMRKSPLGSLRTFRSIALIALWQE